MATQYALEQADELVFLDISATEQKRKTLADLVLRVAEAIDIPFTVGGGISSVKDVEILLKMELIRFRLTLLLLTIQI